jgi:hypothetical protein
MTTPALSLQAKYEAVVAAIMNVVPEKERIARCFSTRKCLCGFRIDEHVDFALTLGDVLRAIKEKVGLYQTSTHPMSPIAMLLGTVDYRCVTEWHLDHDSLAWHRDNAPETIEFLHSLLYR